MLHVCPDCLLEGLIYLFSFSRKCLRFLKKLFLVILSENSKALTFSSLPVKNICFAVVSIDHCVPVSG